MKDNNDQQFKHPPIILCLAKLEELQFHM